MNSRPRAEIEAWGEIPFDKRLDVGDVTERKIKDGWCFDLIK